GLSGNFLAYAFSCRSSNSRWGALDDSKNPSLGSFSNVSGNGEHLAHTHLRRTKRSPNRLNPLGNIALGNVGKSGEIQTFILNAYETDCPSRFTNSKTRCRSF